MITLAVYILFTVLYGPVNVLLERHIREVELSVIGQEKNDSFVLLKANGSFDFSNFFKEGSAGRGTAPLYYYAFHDRAGEKGFYVAADMQPDEMKDKYSGRVFITCRKRNFTESQWQKLTGFRDIHEMNRFLLDDTELFNYIKSNQSFDEKGIETFMKRRYEKRFGKAGRCSFNFYLQLCSEDDIKSTGFDMIADFPAIGLSLFLIVAGLRRIIWFRQEWSNPLDGPFI